MSDNTYSPPSKRRKGLPFRIQIEPRLTEPPRWYPYAVSLGAVIVALTIGGIVLALAGGDPLRSYAHIARASFGSLGVFSDRLLRGRPPVSHPDRHVAGVFPRCVFTELQI